MATKEEYAQLSLYVYDVDRVDNRPLIPEGWESLEYHPDNVFGFSYGVFRRIGTTEVVIAYTGTNGGIDYVVDGLSFLGLSSPQTVQAAMAYIQAKEQYGSDITFTGHSLGGGLASIMAVWFDRPATVFDEAPFEITARNLSLTAITKAALALAGYSDEAFTSYTGLFDFDTRETQVTDYYASGEFLQDTRQPSVAILGSENRVEFGIDNMPPYSIDMHSQALLTAGLLSDDFREATLTVQRTLPILMNKAFYAYNTDTSNEQNVLINFIRSEQGTGDKLTHFAADLQKLGTDIAGLNQAAQDALIAQGIEWYYWQGTDYAGEEFFTQTGELLQYTTAQGDGLPNALNKAASYANKWLAPIADSHGASGGSVNYDQWNVVAGSTGSTATARDADKSQIFIGGAGADTLTGGNKGDTFFAGDGNDTLNGGDGDVAGDWLYGGAGNDTYQFSGSWGSDTIIDSDGQGQIEIDGMVLQGGKKVAEGLWINKEQGILYTLVGSGAEQMLLIQRDSSLNSIRVRGWHSGDLGLTMDDQPAEADEPTRTYSGDQRALLRGIEIDQGVVMPGDPAYNTYKWGATSWNADGTLNGGVAEADFNDVIDGSADSDRIDGLGGNDALDGGAGDDIIDGGAGDDFIGGGAGSDIIHGGAGKDVILSATGLAVYQRIGPDEQWSPPAGTTVWSAGSNWGVYTDTGGGRTIVNGGPYAMDSAGDVVDAGDGDDIVIGGLGADYLDGGDGDDVIWGHGGSDILLGAAGDDYLAGDGLKAPGFYETLDGTQHGNDFLDGGEGNDTLVGGGANDVLYGGAGVDFLWGDDLSETKLAGTFHGDDYLDGEDGDDQLVGGGGNDTLYGGAGNDNMWGDGSESTLAGTFHGDDYLDGEGGDDQLVGGGGNDTLYGGADNDSMWGDGSESTLAGTFHGDDYLDGEDGDDQLIGGGGNDTLYGGAGVDLLLGDDREANLAGEFHGADYLDGEEGNDTLAGGGGDDTLFGGLDNDVLLGDDESESALAGEFHGNDYLDGGDGDDLLFGGGKDDTLYGGDGVDELQGDATQAYLSGEFHGNDYLDGGDGDDRLFGQGRDDILIGGAGDDYLSGDGNLSEVAAEFHGNDYLDGGDGNDTLYGGGGDDILIGGAGNDFLSGEDQTSPIFASTLAGNDTLYGGDGNDTLLAGNGNNYLSGDAGDDYLWGGDGDDVLIGGAGNDFIRSGAGNDTMDGGEGSDTYYVALGSGVKHIQDVNDGGWNSLVLEGGFTLGMVRLSLGSLVIGSASGDSEIHLDGVDYDDLAGSSPINEIQFSDSTTMTIAELIDAVPIEIPATEGADTLRGTSGNEIIHALAGDDFVDGRAGNDVLDLGAGNDTAYGGDGNDIVTGGDGDDTLYGDAGADQLDGGAGDDILAGGTGNDTLDGGTGADAMSGGDGDDTYTVDAAGDTVVENAGEGHDLVLSSIDYVLGANVEDLRLLGGSAAQSGTGNTLDNAIEGNELDNTLLGLDGSDTLSGGAGNDTLDGGSGADTLIGGAGDDVYFVDDASDTVTELYGEGIDTVHASVSHVLSANVENLVLTGALAFDGTGNALANAIEGNELDNTLLGLDGGDTLSGGAGDDLLDGGSGADTLIGGMGDDRLVGGSGADTMIGGAGDDTYVVDDAQDVVVELQGEGTDTVESAVDYTLGADLENLTLTGWAANGTGNAGDNVLIGNASSNRLDGGGGEDLMEGGLGDDTYVVDSAGDVVVELADEGNDTVEIATSFSLSSIANIENVTLTGTGNVNATGNDGDNELEGNAGNNVLDGGLGADWMAGGAGDDTYIVDEAGDWVVEAWDEGTDTIVRGFDTTLVLESNVENLTLAGSVYRGNGNELDNVIIGNDADNNLLGLGGNDTLVGGAGDDALFGSEGQDTLIGGTGDDYYEVDDAGDVIVENAGEGDDFVRSTVSWTLGANVERLALDGEDDLDATGNALDNGLWGNAGNNTLTGGLGNDYLQGGAGDDVYVFTAGDGQDTIDATDLKGADDVLRLHGVSASQVSLMAYGEHLFLLMPGGDQIALYNHFAADTSIDGAAADAKIDHIVFDGGDSWDQAKIQQLLDAAASNQPPTINHGLPPLQAMADTPFSYVIPADTITDPDAGDSVTYSVTLQSGAALPAWLSFNASTRTLSGTPTAAEAGNLSLVVWGTDNYGHSIGLLASMAVSAGPTAPPNSYTYNYTMPNGQSGFTVTGNAPYNIKGNGSANTITGNDGPNVLNGAGGNDTLKGGKGADTYFMESGTGTDTIVENDATAGVIDILQWGSGITDDKLWFRQVANDLEVSVIGTGNKALVKDWYSGSANHVEQIWADGKMLSDTKVDALVDAMASFAVPTSGQTSLPPSYQTVLNPVIAANWQ